MSEMFFRRSFLKRSAAFIGAVALAVAMIGCSGSRKTTFDALGFSYADPSPYAETDPDYNPGLSGGGSSSGNPDTTRYYNIGSGIELASKVGVLCTKPRGLQGKYPGLTMILKNTSDKDLVLKASQLGEAYFNGKSVPIAGLKLGKDPITDQIIFTQTMTIPKNNAVSVFVYLDAPAENLVPSGQSISLSFSLNGTKKVHISGLYKDKTTFTITY